MSAEGEKPTRRFGAITVVALSVLAVFLVIVPLALTGFSLLAEIGIALVTGWTTFLGRTLPQITFNPSIAGMALLCSILIVVLGHLLLSGLGTAIAARKSEGPVDRPWRWQWTLCGFFSLGVVFLVGMATAGIAHQIGWMAGSPEPMVVSDSATRQGRNEFMQLSSTAQTFEAYAAEHGLQQATRAYRERMVNPGHSDSYHEFLIVGKGGELRGLLFFPRHRPEGRWGGALHIDGETTHLSTSEELDAQVKRYRTQLRPIGR